MTDYDSWIREPLWSETVDRLDDKLLADLSNIGELCREIPLRVFGQILLDPTSWLSRAGGFLPTMPSDEVQFQWTGNSGVVLLEQSVDFIRTVVEAAALNGLDPGDCRVLDFGIGWGRLARLWLKFAAPELLDGCDAWQDSLDKATECGLRNRLVRSDPLLNELPFAEASFGIVWAFSVFTHLSPDAMLHGLSGLRRMLDPKGILVFTVRPHCYWDLPHPQEVLNDAGDRLFETPDVRFVQHQADDPYYGDLSMSRAFLVETCRNAGLQLDSMAWSLRDPYQVVAVARRS